MIKFKRFAAIVLTLCILASMLPTVTLAAGTSNLSFALNSDGKSYSLTDCDEEASGSLAIPATYNGKPVTSIGNGAFSYCESLTSVTIPDSVTSIGDRAFYSCDSLTSVTIGDSVTSIGDRAFYSCDSLTSITIPDSVTSIGNYAFENCDSLTSVTLPDSVISIGDYAFCSCDSLTSISIPDSVISIGDYAFSQCYSLTSITLPDSVTSIGNRVFYYCTRLTEIRVDENNSAYSSDSNGVLYNRNKTTLIQAPCGITAHIIPDSVTSIGDYAFCYCKSLTSVTIPDSVTSIGDRAFYSCDSLTSVTLPDSVTCIGDDAFFCCTGLTSITIPDSVISIGNYAFDRCSSLTSVTIPDSVTSIGSYAFSDCTGLTSITIPDSVTSIGNHAFYGCERLTGIQVDENNSVYSSDSYGVLYNKYKTTLVQAPGGITGVYIIPDSVTSIGSYAFYNCDSLTSVTIPGTVSSLNRTFRGCSSLKEVSIENGVISIRDKVFLGCTNLTSISIPSSVTSIGGSAFYICNNLTDVYYDGSEAQWNMISFGGGNDSLLDATIHYAEDNIDITYEQLFTLYPDYLNPQQETAVINSFIHTYADTLGENSNAHDFLLSYMYSLKEGSSKILARELLAKFGLGESLEEKLIADTSEALIKEILQYDAELSSITKEISDNFKIIKNSYELTTTIGKQVLFDDLCDACKHLSYETINKSMDEIFKNSKKFMTAIGDGVEFWQLIVGMIELQELEQAAICKIRDGLNDNSDFAKALDKLLDDINADPAAYMIEYYGSDFALEKLSKALNKAFWLGKFDSYSLIAASVDIVIKVFFQVYPGALADDIYQTTLLSSYVSEFSAAIDSHRTEFIRAKANGNLVGQDDIEEYKYLYQAYIVTIRETLKNALVTSKTDAQKGNVQNALDLCGRFTYDDYIQWCIANVKTDIRAGLIAAPNNTAGNLSACVKETYPSYGTIVITREDANIMDRPCSVNTDVYAQLIESGALNAEYTVTGLYLNIANNYWYQVITKSGETGYIYSENCEFKEFLSDAVISGLDVPSCIEASSSYYIKGTVSTKHTNITQLSFLVYNQSGELQTGGTVDVSGKYYVLNNSALDASVKFGTLPVGTYHCVIQARIENMSASECSLENIVLHTSQLTVEDHNYREHITVVETCDSAGIRTYTCSGCGHSYTEEIPATGHSFINGVCNKCGDMIPFAAIDNKGNTIGYYATLSEALSETVKGKMLLLQADVDEKNVVIPSGINLDLNGYTLTADSVLTYVDSAIIDTSEDASGLLKIGDEDGNMISADNTQLPVYDAENDGYRFFAMDVQPCAVTGGNKYWFRIKAEKFAPLYDLIQADSDVQIKVKMTWDGQTEDTYAVANLSFTKTWAESYNANEDIYVTVTVDEGEGLENFKLIPMITSGGVEIPGEEM